MALLDYEGFDRETNLALSNWWTFGVGSGTVSADGTGPLSYGRYLGVPYGNGRGFTAKQVVWWQGHIWVNSVPNGDWSVKLNDSGASQCLFGFTSDLKGKVWIDGASSSTPSPIIALGAWYWIQIRVRVATTGGYYEIWVNGVLQHTFTGDTQITANASVNQWALFNSSGERFDNVMVYDETGDAPNARTAECRIYSDLADADDVVAMTPSAGSNYECVDEQPNDGDTTYVSTAVPATDIYSFPTSITPGSVVYAVGVEYVARKDDGGSNILNSLIDVGGVSYDGASNGLTTTFQRFRDFWGVNPATGLPWTVAQATAVKAGVERNT